MMEHPDVPRQRTGEAAGPHASVGGPFTDTTQDRISARGGSGYPAPFCRRRLRAAAALRPSAGCYMMLGAAIGVVTLAVAKAGDEP
jgi:hypothetical protein